MKMLLVAVGCLAVLAAAGAGWMILRLTAINPTVSEERVAMTSEVRCRLSQLRQETKFQAHEFPPIGYTGPATAEDAAIMNRAVNGFLDDLLAAHDDELAARDVSSAMKRVVDQVFWLETEDRDRVYGYLTEAWYILGFRGATGHFSKPDPQRPAPEGYAESLPPGWGSPDQPRLVGACL